MSTQNMNILDDDRIGRLLARLSVPAFLGMFVITMYNIIDTIFIGHYVGPLGIAGLSIVFPLQMLSLGISQMTGIGGASLVSRLLGAGNIQKAQHALGNVISFNILLSIIITITGLAALDFWLDLMGSSKTILPYARDYMSIILVGLVFQTLGMSLNGMIRAEGNARVAMIGMIIGAVLNIALDAVFIISLDMGIKGAAMATVIAQFIVVAYIMIYYFSGKSFLKINMQNMALDLRILKDILAIGIASFARTLTTSISAVFVNRVLISYGGDIAVSAFGVVNRLVMFAIMPSISIGQGLQPVLGYNYGAGRYDRALRAIKLAMSVATAYSFAAFIFLYFIPDVFARIFTHDSGLVALSAHAARRIFQVMFLTGFLMVGSLVFQSIGKAVQSFITSISRSALFLIPLVFILPRFFQLDGVWMAFPIADILTFILTLAFLIPLARELKNNSRQG